MRKLRGFKLRKRVTALCRWAFRAKKHSVSSYQRLNPPPTAYGSKSAAAISRLWNWGHRLKARAKSLCSAKSSPCMTSGSGRGYAQMGREKPEEVPKGHLAVYVGQKDGDFQRVLVPVIYFNHPLFGELLREAEQEYGFHHPGGITIPCRISEFESVQTRIAAVHGSRKSPAKRPF
ncbi:auxin-responsive protein SAUR36 [Malania oleifera]|uniref:auxin-responsive protein SAUR36 n=1 Tax=Malania oleifera TaxID=397392 RepID=UPI0025AEB000|nr:auxin-responsive protein SAUR36 [Malania oleifera]